MHQLDAPAGGRQIDSATAYAALHTQQAPAAPLDAALPGLGPAPGTEKPVAPVVIRCRPGQNAMVPIAENFPNRFDTPFVDPHVIDTKGDDSNMRVSNSLFLTANRTTPFAIWIVNGKAGSQMCSLTLIPQNIPAQNLVLQMEGAIRGDPDSAFARGARDEETGLESQYTIGLRTLMRTVARGIAPRGFSEERLEVGMAVSNGIAAKPEHLYAGSQFDIYVYRLTNTSKSPVTLSEEAFGTKGVRAVAFNPYIILPPGQSTEVYIIADRPDADATDPEAEVGLQ
ncbi:TraK domain-containing protein [Burkholderia gladioli]|nr:type-F conjugative transfer system secretin TraK [Burkholderia gladioli]